MEAVMATKNTRYVLADGTEIHVNEQRRAPRNGKRFWVHSYVSFVDGTGAARVITSAEFNKLVKRGWIRVEVLSGQLAALRQMNATTGFFIG